MRFGVINGKLDQTIFEKVFGNKNALEIFLKDFKILFEILVVVKGEWKRDSTRIQDNLSIDDPLSEEEGGKV